MSKEDKGMDLERRIHRYLWASDYFVRRDIKMLLAPGTEITDLDVYGIRFDEILRPHRVAFEAKHAEAGFSNILQLRGIADYYHIDDPTLVRKAIPRDVHRFIRDLGMHALTHTHLTELEEARNVTVLPFVGSFAPQVDAARDAYRKTLGKSPTAKALLWRMHEAWMIREPHRRLSFIEEAFQGVQDVYAKYEEGDDERALRWLLIENFVMAALAIAEIASDNFDEPLPSRKERIISQTLGGEAARGEKERVIHLVKRIIEAAHLPVDENSFSLDPPFAPALAQLIGQIIQKAHLCNAYLRFVDYAAYEFCLPGRKMDLELVEKMTGVGKAQAKLYASWNEALLDVLGSRGSSTRVFSPIL